MPFRYFPSRKVFEHQPDAVLDQTDPDSGTKYVVLDTTKNVRIISIMIQCTWTVQPNPLEIWLTIDGQVLRFYFSDPESATPYFAFLNPGGPVTNEGLTVNMAYAVYKAFLIEGRNIKVEAEITGGTVSNLSARVKWAKIP